MVQHADLLLPGHGAQDAGEFRGPRRRRCRFQAVSAAVLINIHPIGAALRTAVA